MAIRTKPTTPESPAECLAEPTAYYLRVLHRLIDKGAAIADGVAQKAEADPAADVTVEFERVARTVRRTIALACKVGDPMRRAGGPAQRRVAARARVLRGVEDVIQDKAADASEAESLNEELLDRMDAPEFEDDIETRPIEEIINEICRDLGLGAFDPGSFPWKRRTPETVTALWTAAAAGRGQKPKAAGPIRVERPRIRVVEKYVPDPDKPLSQWTDEELERAYLRDPDG